MKDAHKDRHDKVLDKIAIIEATSRPKRRITLEEAERMAQAAAIERDKKRRKKGYLGKKRPGLKSNGLSWLTAFQRAVMLAFTDVKKYGLPRTWFRRRIKLPREGI